MALFVKFRHSFFYVDSLSCAPQATVPSGSRPGDHGGTGQADGDAKTVPPLPPLDTYRPPAKHAAASGVTSPNTQTPSVVYQIEMRRWGRLRTVRKNFSLRFAHRATDTMYAPPDGRRSRDMAGFGVPEPIQQEPQTYQNRSALAFSARALSALFMSSKMRRLVALMMGTINGTSKPLYVSR